MGRQIILRPPSQTSLHGGEWLPLIATAISDLGARGVGSSHLSTEGSAPSPASDRREADACAAASREEGLEDIRAAGSSALRVAHLDVETTSERAGSSRSVASGLIENCEFVSSEGSASAFEWDGGRLGPLCPGENSSSEACNPISRIAQLWTKYTKFYPEGPLPHYKESMDVWSNKYEGKSIMDTMRDVASNRRMKNFELILFMLKCKSEDEGSFMIFHRRKAGNAEPPLPLGKSRLGFASVLPRHKVPSYQIMAMDSSRGENDWSVEAWLKDPSIMALFCRQLHKELREPYGKRFSKRDQALIDGIRKQAMPFIFKDNSSETYKLMRRQFHCITNRYGPEPIPRAKFLASTPSAVDCAQSHDSLVCDDHQNRRAQ